ncbi:MAG: hypothetical protein E6543_06840, partial [Enterobacter hormaechei]|nr:hypothetical protein [Enterobacter hormaechei]
DVVTDVVELAGFFDRGHEPLTFSLLLQLPAVEVSTEQCTPTALRFEGRTEEDFVQPGNAAVIAYSNDGVILRLNLS